MADDQVDDEAPAAGAAPQTKAAPTGTVKLANRKLTAAGSMLGLRPGDVLAGVNGAPFIGTVQDLNARFKQSGGKPLALSFRRGKIDLTVLADHPNLGKWEATDPVSGWTGDGDDPVMMRNWEVLRASDGSYDLHSLSPDNLALFLPPVWLLKSRLWVATAAIIAALVTAGMIWVPLAAVVYILAGLTLRKSGATLYRLDRINMGMAPYAIVAATTEAGAHAAYGKIDPKGRFMFAAPKEETAEHELTED